MWDALEWIVLAALLASGVLAYLAPRLTMGLRSRLKRLLGDGTAVGLRLADPAERQSLGEFLRAQLGGWARKVRLGAVYRARDDEAYVFEMALARRDSGGASVELRVETWVRLFLIGPTGIRRAFAVKPLPSLNVTGDTRLHLAEDLGLVFRESEVDLPDGFRLFYSVHSAAPGVDRIPMALQDILARQAEIPGPRPPLWLFDAGEVVLAPQFVALNLGRPPERIEDVRSALEFARLVRGTLAGPHDASEQRPE